MTWLFRRDWSPIAAGVVIGLLQLPAYLFLATALGASSSFVTVDAVIAGFFDKDLPAYLIRHTQTVKDWWQLAMVVGIAIGAFASARLSGTRRAPVSPFWAKSPLQRTPAQRYILAFVGGFMLLLGARIADGCTSGHGISGLAQLAVGSAIVITFMFIAGAAAAFALYGRR